MKNNRKFIALKSISIAILLLISRPLISDENSSENIDLSSPRHTMKTFLKSMKKFKLGNTEGIQEALKTLDLSALNKNTRKKSGKLAAQRLIQTFDRLERIDYKNIPEKMTGEIWYYKNVEIIIDGRQVPVEIAISKMKNNDWLFTKKTIRSIKTYRKFLSNKKIVKGVIELKNWTNKVKEKMPDWMGHRTMVLLNGQWIGIFLLIFLGILLEKILILYIGGMITRILAKKNSPLAEKAKKNFLGPIGMLFFFAFWSLGIGILEFDDKVLSFLSRAGYVGLTVAAVLAAYHFVDVIAVHFLNLAKKSENKFDDILVPLISKTAKFFIFAIGIVFIGDSLTFDMKNILAGLGIGGLAFALAAKDTLSNIFGSLTVLIDRPFHIGDWVLIGGNIEGTVEEVGLRSTRIRTFYDSQITLPNGQLTNIHIDNYGRREYRRYSTKIGVQYDTPPDKIEAFCEGIRKIILTHKWTRKDYFHVYLSGMGDSALEILIYVFWKVPDWSSELQEKHRLVLDILRLGQELGVEFAFPTQTLHLFNENKSDLPPMSMDQLPQEYGSNLGNKLAKNTLSAKKHRSGVLDIPKKDDIGL